MCDDLSEWVSEKPVGVPKARKLMYGRLMALQRRRIDILGAIFEELKREGIGSGQPWHECCETISKARGAHIEEWQDAQLGSDPPGTANAA
jgi:hypothetical protein